ncbi:MAG: hypothetical protein AVDCRST_MAG49-179 [uncultured Thermomicrobiales bacterium]|uniref:Uncharacterized protein n=1 Tax=uncultured Thermomicrobiales bacterium TaxID=1645740 RepID=A0A6J4TYA2_9BACT|nr:MAG: hypothetical protein AVDCRST_MAG49-179 [uncultured Thermomicrobiales bacterium]
MVALSVAAIRWRAAGWIRQAGPIRMAGGESEARGRPDLPLANIGLTDEAA